MPNVNLSGRVILVTGASRGFGRATAQACYESGATVISVSRTTTAPLSGRKGTHGQLHIAADLEEGNSAGHIFDEVRRAYGRLDGIVHNAAIQGPIGPFEGNEWREWERTIAVNLVAPAALTRACLPLLAGPVRRKIVFISGGGATSPRQSFSAYAASKAGLVRFAETLALEVCDDGIDVNCVAPGAMPTAMTDTILDAGAALAGEHEHERARQLKQQNSEVAARAASLCCLLLSSASDGVTGRLVSAVWDPWERLPELSTELAGTDIYTLRRIVPEDRQRHW